MPENKDPPPPAGTAGRPPAEVLECEFLVRPREPGGAGYPLLALLPTGPASGLVKLDPTREDFRRLRDLACEDTPDPDRRREFGRLLFDALTAEPAVRDGWQATRGRLGGQDVGGLRLRLWVEPPELLGLPWELLYDERTDHLAARPDVHLSRYLPGLEPPSPPSPSRPRVLLVVADPPGGLTPVDRQVLAGARAALADLAPDAWDELTNPAVDEVLARLRDYHVLHFMGHGEAGRLLWVRPGGERQVLEAEQLSRLVLGQRQLRLVVLNACGSAEAVSGGRFGGVGAAFVRGGVPGVVAMQYPVVAQPSAGAFNRAFYRALKDGLTADEAVTAGRRALLLGPGGADARDWSAPVLYLGTRRPGGLSLGGRGRRDPWEELRAATEASAQARAALRAAGAGLGELAGRLRAVGALLALGEASGAARRQWAPTRAAAADLERAGRLPDRGQFVRAEEAWRDLKAGPWGRAVELAGATGAAWLGDARAAAAEMDRVLGDVAVGALVRAVNGVDAVLARAEDEALRAVAEKAGDAARLAADALAHVPAE
jgi:hypothetical protein